MSVQLEMICVLAETTRSQKPGKLIHPSVHGHLNHNGLYVQSCHSPGRLLLSQIRLPKPCVCVYVSTTHFLLK